MKTDDRVLLCLERYSTSTSAVYDADDDDVVANTTDCNYRDSDDHDLDFVRTQCRRAFQCPTLISDSRVLRNLRDAEKNCRPPANCLAKQTEVQPYMRTVVASWMLEVLEEQRCDEEVFSLAVNYFDRILASTPVRKSELQLIGTVCMFIASKFKDTIAIPADRLVMYTDFSINVDQLLDWELLILQALHWDLSAVTPHDFLEQLLSRLPIEPRDRMSSVKRHAQTFIAMCTADPAFSSCLPSTMAAASISAAASGLLGHVWCDQVKLVHRLHRLIKTDIADIRACQDRIEQLLNNRVRQTSVEQQSTSPTTTTSLSTSKTDSGPVTPHHPSTPTDVRDIRVCS